MLLMAEPFSINQDRILNFASVVLNEGIEKI